MTNGHSASHKAKALGSQVAQYLQELDPEPISTRYHPMGLEPLERLDPLEPLETDHV